MVQLEVRSAPKRYRRPYCVQLLYTAADTGVATVYSRHLMPNIAWKRLVEELARARGRSLHVIRRALFGVHAKLLHFSHLEEVQKQVCVFEGRESKRARETYIQTEKA